MFFLLSLPHPGFLESLDRAIVVRHHPGQQLALELEPCGARRGVLVQVVVDDDRFGHCIDQIGRLGSVGREDRVRIVRLLGGLFLADADATGGHVRGVVRADLVNARPTRFVRSRCLWKKQTARRSLDLFRLRRNRRRNRGIGLVIQDALPHRAIAGKLNQLHVALAKTAERQQRECVLIQRRRAHDGADTLALEILELLDAGILGHAQPDPVAIVGRHDQAQLLRPPVLDAEFERAFLREVHADAHVGRLRPTAAQRREARDVVARRQHAHVGGMLVLEHLAHGNRDVESGRTGVVGRDGQRLGQLDVLRDGGERSTERGDKRRSERDTRAVKTVKGSGHGVASKYNYVLPSCTVNPRSPI